MVGRTKPPGGGRRPGGFGGHGDDDRRPSGNRDSRPPGGRPPRRIEGEEGSGNRSRAPWQSQGRDRPTFERGAAPSAPRSDAPRRDDESRGPRFPSRPRFGGDERPRFGGDERPRFSDSERPRFGGDERPRFGGERPRYDGEGTRNFPPPESRASSAPLARPTPPTRMVRYQVVTMGEEDTGNDLESRLNVLGRTGWRLVAIDEGRQYVFMTLE